MEKVFAGLAILASGIYAGAAWYLTFVELPALSSLSARCARAQWVQTVRRTPRYAASALIATAAALGAGHAKWRPLPGVGRPMVKRSQPHSVLAVIPAVARVLRMVDVIPRGLPHLCR